MCRTFFLPVVGETGCWPVVAGGHLTVIMDLTTGQGRLLCRKDSLQKPDKSDMSAPVRLNRGMLGLPAEGLLAHRLSPDLCESPGSRDGSPGGRSRLVDRRGGSGSGSSSPDGGMLHSENDRLHPEPGRIHPENGRIHPENGRLHAINERLHPESAQLYPERERLQLENGRLHPEIDRLHASDRLHPKADDEDDSDHNVFNNNHQNNNHKDSGEVGHENLGGGPGAPPRPPHGPGAPPRPPHLRPISFSVADILDPSKYNGIRLHNPWTKLRPLSLHGDLTRRATYDEGEMILVLTF